LRGDVFDEATQFLFNIDWIASLRSQ